MAFQGRFEAGIFPRLGLPRAAWSIDGVEFHGGVGFLKAGLVAADAITTVSPTYAAEILSPEFGMGLEGVIASRARPGLRHRQRHRHRDVEPGRATRTSPRPIRPATSPAAPPTSARWRHASGSTAAMARCSSSISRLTWQKGMDVLRRMPRPSGRRSAGGWRCWVRAMPAIESQLQAAAARHPGAIGLQIGYDERLSHLHAGRRRRDPGAEPVRALRPDPALRPRLWLRPGGLAHRRPRRYRDRRQSRRARRRRRHRIPVRRGRTATRWPRAIRRAVDAYARPQVWRTIQRNGMRGDFSWARSGKAYADLYRRLAAPAASA